MQSSPSSCSCGEQGATHSLGSSKGSGPLSLASANDIPNAAMSIVVSRPLSGNGQTDEHAKNERHITSSTAATAIAVPMNSKAGGRNAMSTTSPPVALSSERPPLRADDSAASVSASSRITTSFAVTTSTEDRASPSKKTSLPVQRKKIIIVQQPVTSMTKENGSEEELAREDNRSNDNNEDNSDDDEQADTESKMSIDKLVPSKKPRKRRVPSVKPGQTSGRWTEQEHQAFLEGLKECGREWKKVAMRIPTRTSAQIRSHAQKYFSKLQRDHETSFYPEGSGVGSSNSACASASTTTQSLPPSVQNNVERILSNPTTVQREVESTLEALRERYRQLQLRLQQRQNQRRNGQGGLDHHRTGQNGDRPPNSQIHLSPRNRGVVELEHRPRVGSSICSAQDDLSSVSSNISASVASMGNDELIALHVLGGGLPRSASGQNLEQMVVRTPADSSDASVASSHISAHNDDCLALEDPENPTSSEPRPSNPNHEPSPKRPKFD